MDNINFKKVLDDGELFDQQANYEDNFEKINQFVVPKITDLETNKVDKETGKGLSTNDYTTTEKNKLAGIPADTAAQLNDMTQDFSAQLAETANNLVEHKLDYVAQVNKINSYTNNVYNYIFVNGARDGDDIKPSSNRIITENIENVTGKMEITIATGYKMGILRYDYIGGNYRVKSDSGWLTTKQYIENEYIRIVLSLSGDGPINPNHKTSLNIISENQFATIGKVKSEVMDLKVSTPNDLITSVAHRGYSQVAPENTLVAYIKAKEAGFAYVETDVRFSSDGYPVLIHDATLDRTSNGTGNVNDTTLANLMTYDYGAWFSPTYTGTQLLQFEEFILAMKKLNIISFVEIKFYQEINGGTFNEKVDILFNIVKKHKMLDNVYWLVNNEETTVPYLVNKYPNINFALLGVLRQDKIDQVASVNNGTGKKWIFVPDYSVTQEGLLLASNSYVKVMAWTVNNPTTAINLINLGVDGIVTDGLNIPYIMKNSI